MPLPGKNQVEIGLRTSDTGCHILLSQLRIRLKNAKFAPQFKQIRIRVSFYFIHATNIYQIFRFANKKIPSVQFYFKNPVRGKNGA
jgi:hypothetical protein